MPIYEIENPNTGQILEIEGQNPPTQAELDKIFEDYKPGSSKLEKLRDNLPLIMGIAGGAVGLPFGLAPITGGVSAGAGYVIKDILTPKKKSDYTGKTKAGFKELSKEGRVNNLKSVGEGAQSMAKTAVAFDLVQALFGSKGSVTGKVTRPKETLTKYRNEQATLNPGPGLKKQDLINQLITKTDPLKEKTGYLKNINNFQQELTQKYSQRPAYLSTNDILNMKTTANAGSYSPTGTLKTNAAGAFDKVTGDVLRTNVAKNSKAVAAADKALSFIYKLPKSVGKFGSGATKVASTIGLLKLLGL